MFFLLITIGNIFILKLLVFSILLFQCLTDIGIFIMEFLKKLASNALKVHLILSIAFGLFVVFTTLNPCTSLTSFGEKGPITNGYALLTSLGLMWCLVTTILISAKLGKINRKTVIPFICGTIISLIYITFLREHEGYGDLSDYIGAVDDIINKQPFNSRYLYPPLWASILTQFYRFLGLPAAIFAIFFANQLSILAFFILATIFLTRYGLSLNFSSILVFFSMVVSVSISRNIVYSQVNLILVDMILASLLLFRKHKFFSALFFALGAHLKVVPIFFIPAYLKFKNWKWLAYLTISGIFIIVVTSLTDGFSYYVDFINNLSGWADAPIRSSSLYGFLINTNKYVGTNIPVKIIWNIIRAISALSIYWLAFLSIKNKSFLGAKEKDPVFSAIIPLSFMMIAISPTVWSHHLVILIVPTILILLHIQKSFHLLIFIIGYFFAYILPVFDLYPWSYLRLLGWLLLLLLTADVIISKRAYAPWVIKLDSEINASLDNIFKIFLK